MSALVDITAPLELEGTRAVVLGWLKQVGETVAADEPVIELETDKVAIEVAAPAAGVLAETLLGKDDNAAPGQVLGRIRAGSSTVRTIGEAPAQRTAKLASAPELRFSPSVRRLLAGSGLDPVALSGTGRGGRLTRADVAAEIARRSAKTPVSAAGSRRAPHDRMRLRIAEHMARSVATAPHVTAVFEADLGAIITHRAANRARLEAQGVALTLTAYFVSAAATAMAAAPAVNSRWHDDYLEIFDHVNIGVGAALGEAGLIVPVIHGAESLSLEEIAARLHDLTTRARAGRLAAADVQGGTFSISNHGVSGSLLAAPIIINQPQSAILGIGKLEKRVVVREVDGAEAILVRPMAYVTLTIDHRAIDAHQTNAWLSRFVKILGAWPAG